MCEHIVENRNVGYSAKYKRCSFSKLRLCPVQITVKFFKFLGDCAVR